MATRVLIVEDEIAIAENLQALLAAKGYEAEFVSDGIEAIARARKEHPDLILLDVMLPKLSGIEVCKILKSDTTTTAIKIIMLTGLGRVADVETAFESGATDYIIKPFNADRLFKKIEKVLTMP